MSLFILFYSKWHNRNTNNVQFLYPSEILSNCFSYQLCISNNQVMRKQLLITKRQKKQWPIYKCSHSKLQIISASAGVHHTDSVTHYQHDSRRVRIFIYCLIRCMWFDYVCYVQLRIYRLIYCILCNKHLIIPIKIHVIYDRALVIEI